MKEYKASIHVVLLDETSAWNSAFLRKYGIKKILGSWIYDSERISVWCSQNKLYQLERMGFVFDLESDDVSEEYRDEIYHAIQDGYKDPTDWKDYYSKSTIDREEEKTHLDTFYYKTEQDYRELFEEIREDEQGNPTY